MTNDLGINSRIGPLYELSQYTKLCGIENCSSFIEKLSLNYTYTRRLFSDGNTFFRAFIFAMIEHYILTENIYELNKLINNFYEITNNTFRIHDENIDREQILHFLFLIKFNVESKNVMAAHQVLIKVYMESPNFDLV